MIYLAIILMVIGAILVVAEIFTPGFGVFGISGLLSVIIAAILTIISSPVGPFIVVGEIVALGAIVFFFLDYARKKQLLHRIVLSETLKEDTTIGDLSFFMGKEGVTKTSLRPVGMVDFNGVSLEVCSDDGYIAENVKVKVVDASKNKLMVKKLGHQ